MNEPWVVCRHTRGGLHVWKLADVCRMNLQRMTRGERMEDEWRPVAVEASEAFARAREAELRKEVREKRREVEKVTGGSVPYPADEEKRDGEE